MFTIVPNRNPSGGYYADEAVDRSETAHSGKAGPHVIGATFIPKTSALLETERQPYDAHFNQDRHPRIQPAVYSVSIGGPFDATGAGDTPSRHRHLRLPCRRNRQARNGAPRRSSPTLARRAYRRAVTEEDLRVPLEVLQGCAGRRRL